MLPAVALGELLIVASVPVAVVIAIVAAFLSRRHRRLARTLVALALLALAGMMFAGRRLSAPLAAARQRQVERFAPLEMGWSREQVEAALGPPDLRCPGEGAYHHEVMGSPELARELYVSTAERWIYSVAPGRPGGEEPRAECQPRYADGEVGFDAQGRAIWFIALTDESFMTF